MTETIAVDEFLPYPPERVWRALADPARLATWFMPNDFEPVVGHEFTFVRKANCEVHFSERIACRVLEVRENELLSYSWTDAVYRGELDSIVTWRLQPEGRGTRVLLAHRGFDLDDELQRAAHRLMTDGWRIYLTERLPGALTDQGAAR